MPRAGAGLAPLVPSTPDCAACAGRVLHVVHWMRQRASAMTHLGDHAGAEAMRAARRLVALELVPLDIDLSGREPEFGVSTWPVSL